jgi:peptide/nickel transport system ATP-binding protein
MKQASKRGQLTDADPVLEVKNLKKYFSQSDGIIQRFIGGPDTTYAVDGVDITIREGQTLAVVGESGCGKTTLAQTIIGLHEPTEGAVYYDGEEISGLSDSNRRPYVRNLQMVFQDPLSSLNPRKTVDKILRAPLEIHGIGDSDTERRDMAKEKLQLVGLEEEHLTRYPRNFSGGQQQRIALARALMLDPDVLIADEPVSALDASVQAQILQLFEDLQARLGISILYIAHDLSTVKYISDRVAVMYLGEIVETGLTEDVFGNPEHPYTKALMSAVPRIGRDTKKERIILKGDPPSPQDPPSGCRFHTRCPAIIPDGTWEGTQSQFKEGFLFRKRVENGDINTTVLENRLGGAERKASENPVRNEIECNHFDNLRSYPDDTVELVRRSIDAYVDGERSSAVELLQSEFGSPCERTKPEGVEHDRDHLVHCHRVDPDKPGEPRFL